MKNYITISDLKGQELNLTYGTFAAKRFSELLDCGTEVFQMMQQFQGKTLYKAKAALILCGAEHNARAAGKPFKMDEFEAMEILDEMPDDLYADMEACFIGSISNKTMEEAKMWLKEIDAAIAEALEKGEVSNEEVKKTSNR